MVNRKTAIRDFRGAFAANLFSLVVTALLVLIVPKFIGIEDYSYWQLYILYVSFVGFLHFGWADGIYLRYGGEKYQELDKKVISSQFWLLFGLEAILSLCLVVYGLLFVGNQDRAFIIALVGLNCVVMNMRTFAQFLLQGTGRITAYSRAVIGERAVYVAIVGILIAIGSRDYENLVIADILTKSITLVILCYICRDVVITKAAGWRTAIGEAKHNIGVGMQLMGANIAGMLVIGAVRLMIEKGWDIQTFGKISLTLTMANLLMVFIGAASIVLYPMIRKSEQGKLPKIYATLRTPLMCAALGMLVFAYPMQVVFTHWLPQYADSLVYIWLLLPICVFELKMSLLILTFLKAMRKERHILGINMVALAVSILLASISVFILKNLELAIITIVVSLAIRATIAEIFLSKELGIKLYKDIGVELSFVAYFMLIGWYISGGGGMLLFLLPYGVYLFIKRHELKASLKIIRG